MHQRLQLGLNFDPATLRQRILYGAGIASLAILGILVLDLLWLSVQGLFPSLVRSKMDPLSLEPSAPYAFPYEEIKQAFETRSLFEWPGEETAQTEFAAPAGLDAELARFELTGIMLGQTHQAFFKDRTTSQTIFAREGQSLGAMSVVEIRSRSVVLRMGTEEREIFLER